MLVQMLTNAAGPEFNLESGKVYNLPNHLAKRFIEGNRARSEPTKDHPEGKEYGPLRTYAKPAPPGSKPTRIPPQPDPEDTAPLPDDEEVTEEDDDE